MFIPKFVFLVLVLVPFSSAFDEEDDYILFNGDRRNTGANVSESRKYEANEEAANQIGRTDQARNGFEKPNDRSDRTTASTPPSATPPSTSAPPTRNGEAVNCNDAISELTKTNALLANSLSELLLRNTQETLTTKLTTTTTTTTARTTTEEEVFKIGDEDFDWFESERAEEKPPTTPPTQAESGEENEQVNKYFYHSDYLQNIFLKRKYK
jgi:hypothetical protein